MSAFRKKLRKNKKSILLTLAGDDGSIKFTMHYDTAELCDDGWRLIQSGEVNLAKTWEALERGHDHWLTPRVKGVPSGLPTGDSPGSATAG